MKQANIKANGTKVKASIKQIYNTLTNELVIKDADNVPKR